MKRSKLFAGVAAGVAFSVAGFTATASAQSADDVAIIVENIPGAVDAIVAGTQAAVDTFVETQSVKEFNNALLLQGPLMGVTTLVAGTEQFGSLPLGVGFMLIGVMGVQEPYLEAIDDPTTAGDLVNPDDLATILAQLQPAMDTAQPHLVTALTEGLQGNITAGTGFFAGTATPATLGNTFVGVREGLRDLLEGTNYESLVNLWATSAGVPLTAAAPYTQQLEDALAPAFEGAAPVTEQIIAVLEGI